MGEHRIRDLAAIAALVSGCAVEGDEQSTTTSSSYASSVLEKQLSSARAATARYHDITVAYADGFAAEGGCVSSPAGIMGTHHVNFGRVVDGTVAIDEPEVLLYLERDDGFRLIGVEYLFPIFIDGAPYFGCGVENNSCPPADPPPPPPLYDGVTMDGPMAGHAEGIPWHYDLHVWIWAHNPSGTFAQWNPALECP